MKVNEYITWDDKNEKYIVTPHKKRIQFSKQISQFIIDEIYDGPLSSIAEKDSIFSFVDPCSDSCNEKMMNDVLYLLKVEVSQRLDNLEDPNKLYDLCVEVVEEMGVKIAAKVLSWKLEKYMQSDK
jgi:hypothetical protein